jgi:hypothetical protein
MVAVAVAVASGCGCMEGVGRNGGLIPVLVVLACSCHILLFFSRCFRRRLQQPWLWGAVRLIPIDIKKHHEHPSQFVPFWYDMIPSSVTNGLVMRKELTGMSSASP